MIMAIKDFLFIHGSRTVYGVPATSVSGWLWPPPMLIRSSTLMLVLVTYPSITGPFHLIGLLLGPWLNSRLREM